MTRPAIAIQGSRPRSRYERIGRSIRRDTRSRIVAGRRKHTTTKTNHVASHAPLDRLGRLEGGNLAEHGGRGDGRHGDRLVTFLERTNGDRRARGGEVDSLRAWIYYSNLDGVFIFIYHRFITCYTISVIHGSEFGHVELTRNTREPTGSIRRGRKEIRESTPNRWIDGSIDGWIGHVEKRVFFQSRLAAAKALDDRRWRWLSLRARGRREGKTREFGRRTESLFLSVRRPIS